MMAAETVSTPPMIAVDTVEFFFDIADPVIDRFKILFAGDV
jgi:hypothetical protein